MHGNEGTANAACVLTQPASVPCLTSGFWLQLQQKAQAAAAAAAAAVAKNVPEDSAALKQEMYIYIRNLYQESDWPGQ